MIGWWQNHLVVLLKVAALIQLCIALLNLWLVQLLGWRTDLQRMPLLLREVFQVHVWFISLTLVIFAVLTWRFAAGLVGADELADWLALGIGAFWGCRTVLQITYYSAGHWRGQLAPTLVHIALVIVYGGMTLVYCSAGIGALNAWHTR